jgi:hypothetical protein
MLLRDATGSCRQALGRWGYVPRESRPTYLPHLELRATAEAHLVDERLAKTGDRLRDVDVDLADTE